MATAAQPLTQTQDFDPIAELRKRYPDPRVSGAPDAKIIDHLSNPDNFRAAFPEFQHLDNDTITRNMARHAPNLPGGTPQLVDAVKAGKAPGAPIQATPFERDRPGTGEITAGGSAKAYANFFKQMPGAAWDAVKGLFNQEENIGKLPSPKGMAAKQQSENIDREASEDAARKAAGRSTVYRVAAPLARAATMGLSDPASMERHAERGESNEIVGESLGAGTMAAAPLIAEGLKPIAKPIGRAVSRVAEPITTISKRVAEPFTTPEAPRALRQAIQPGVNIPRAGESIEIAGPRLQQVKATMKGPDGMPFEYKSPADLLEGVKAAKSYIHDSIEQRLGPVADLAPDASPIAKAMEDSISQRTERQSPETAQRIRDRAATYRTNMPLREIENSIQDANNELRNFYKRSNGNDSPVGPDLDATLAEVKALRSHLDDKVGELSGDGVADLKREYGALRDVERAAAKAHAVSTRQKGATLWEGLAALHAAGDFMTGNAVGALKGAGVLAMGKRLKNLRDPNFLIDKAFQGDKAFKAAGEVAPPPQRNVKGALPAPPTPMPGGADASGPVRGGRYTTPAALLPDEKPIAAKFIREIPKSQPAAPFRAKGLLKSSEPPPTNVPPIVEDKFARETIGRVQDESKLGPTGEGGTVGGRKALPAPKPPHGMTQPSPIMKPSSPSAIPFIREEARPPATPYTPKEMEEAELLVRQTHDMMTSSDKPGRYYSENQPGEYNSQKEQSAEKGVTAGGHWFGVKSMRTMLPWIKDTEFTPSQLERGMREGGNLALREKILNSAARFIRAENEKSAGTAYRAHDVGKTDVDLGAHAHATASKTEALDYAEHRNPGTPQQVSKINIGKWKPEDFEDFEGPNGKKWFKFKRQPTPEEYE